jgi:hypothetical protein
MSRAARAVLVGGQTALAEGIVVALGGDVQRVHAAELDRCEEALLDAPDASTLVWLHVAPAVDDADAPPTAEADLLIRSAHAARAAADAHGGPVVFIALLPMPGMVVGPRRLGCDLAAAAMSSVMRTEIADWSHSGRRIVGIVYGGVAGNDMPGQRRLEEVRARTPMQRLATVAELTDAVRFAACERSAYLTGTTLRVDGGSDAYSWVYPARTI